MSGQQPQIEMQCVSKRFNGTLALDSASFSLPPGEIVGLLGSNGAGKTTALRCLVGLLRPTDGRCLVCGIDPQVDAIAVRRVVGFSPDEPQFTPHLTGREILDFVTAIRNVDPMAAKERLARLIPSWNFEAELGVETRKYSLGARKKLALLLALIHDPPVLLLDEPTNGLDLDSTLALRDVLRDAAGRGCTVLVSTHVLENVEKIAHRIVILDRGSVKAEGTFDALKLKAGVSSDASLEDTWIALHAGTK